MRVRPFQEFFSEHRKRPGEVWKTKGKLTDTLTGKPWKRKRGRPVLIVGYTTGDRVQVIPGSTTDLETRKWAIILDPKDYPFLKSRTAFPCEQAQYHPKEDLYEYLDLISVKDLNRIVARIKELRRLAAQGLL